MVLLCVLVGVQEVFAQSGGAAGFRLIHGCDSCCDGILQGTTLKQDLGASTLQL